MVAKIVVTTILAPDCLWLNNPDKDWRYTDYLRETVMRRYANEMVEQASMEAQEEEGPA